MKETSLPPFQYYIIFFVLFPFLIHFARRPSQTPTLRTPDLLPAFSHLFQHSARPRRIGLVPSLNTTTPRPAQFLITAISGAYDNLEYSGEERTVWNVVELSRKNSTTLQWKNCENVAWEMHLLEVNGGYDPTKLNLSTDCPFYTLGHKVANVMWNEGGTAVICITGPWDESYTRVSTAREVGEAVEGTYRIAEEHSEHAKVTVKWDSIDKLKVDSTSFSCGMELQANSSGYRESSFIAQDGCSRNWSDPSVERDELFGTVRRLHGPSSTLYGYADDSSTIYTRVIKTDEVVTALVSNYHSHAPYGLLAGRHRIYISTTNNMTAQVMAGQITVAVIYPEQTDPFRVGDTDFHSYVIRSNLIEPSKGFFYWNPSRTKIIAIQWPDAGVYYRVGK